MTLYGEPRVWLEQFPLGERVPFTCQHLGLEYPGEVVRADTWSPRWGNPLNGEVYFRVVLRQRRGGLEPVLRDPRIAVCLPASGQYRRRSRLATEVSTTRETQAVYDSIRGTYSDFRRWESDLAILRGLAGLARSISEISGASEYLKEAEIPPETHPELSVDRQALLASLAPGSLAQSPGRNWDVLIRDVAGFKARYLDAYRTHHENFRAGAPVYIRDLGSARLKLRALEHLNTLAELGRPTGAGLEDRIEELGPEPSPCSVAGPEVQLDSHPWCGECGLTLEFQLPLDQLASLTAVVDTDLGAKNRQLSTLLVERILQGKQDERLDDLLKIVQASDLSALSNTINAELMGFIQGIIS